MHPEDETARLPIVEEQVVVDKVAAITDRVRVITIVDTREVVIEDVVRRGNIAIERRAANREVTEAPPPREEGDRLIISLVEERLVKRLFVVEEVHVRQTTTTEAVSLPTTLRSTRATVEHPNEPPTGGRLKWPI